MDISYNIIKHLMKGEHIHIKCKKPFFFNAKYNAYSNMIVFNKKMQYIYKYYVK